MKMGRLKRFACTALAAGMLLSMATVSAQAAEPDSVKEFREGKTKSAVNGERAAMVIQQDGSLWAYGRSENGLLGNNGAYDKTMAFSSTVATFRTYPEKVLSDVSFVDSNSDMTLAVKNDGTLWATGFPTENQLENGFVVDYKMQMSFIKLADNVISGTAYPYSNSSEAGSQLVSGTVVCMIKNDKSLWMIDIPAVEETEIDKTPTSGGDGSMAAVSGPSGYTRWKIQPEKKIMDNVEKIKSLGYKNAYLTADGGLYSWDSFSNSDNGQKNLLESSVKIMSDVKDFDISGNGIYAIKKDGSLWFISDSSEITKIADNIKSANGTHVIDNNGIVYTYSETYESIATRKLVQSSLSGVTSLGQGGGYIIKNDGSLWGNTVHSWDGSVGEVKNNFVQLTGLSVKPQETDAPKIQTAKPTSSKVLVNGKETAFNAYSINDNNYFKLRDLASVLSTSSKQFDVSWDNDKQAINLLSGKAYTVVGGEFAKGDSSNKTATLNTSKVYLDGKEISLTAYTIDGNNYFKLRDLGQTFNFGVGWDGAVNTVTIDTSKNYTAE